MVDLVMGELEQLDVSDETWGAKAKVMKENVEHHMEEEEGEMFKQARRVFDRAELDDLGRRMAERQGVGRSRARDPGPGGSIGHGDRRGSRCAREAAGPGPWPAHTALA